MRTLVLILSSLSAGYGAFDPAQDLIIRWPGPETPAAALLRQAGVKAVVLPARGSESAARACRDAGILAIAEMDSPGPPPEGFSGIACDAAASEAATRAAAGKNAGLLQLVYLKPEQIHWRVAPALAVLRAGQWPGIRPRDPSKATASEAPWIDANPYYLAYLRGLFPERPALLGYRPDEDAGVSKERVLPYATLEVGLAEALAAGGNAVLTIPDDYRKALLAGDAKALSAWQSLGRMARFLAGQAATFRRPLATRVAVAASSLEHHGELLNMMYRRNVAPAVFNPAALPGFSPSGFRILVASGVGSSEAARKSALAFAAAGGRLLAAPAENEKPWWTAAGARKTGSTEEFDCFEFGKGVIFGYREPIIDPAEFALDVIDAEGDGTRDLRLYNADSVVGIPHRLPGGGISVELINYGGQTQDFMVRVEGAFRKATWRTPEGPPTVLKLTRQGTGTEVEVLYMNRFASILLE